MSKAALYLHVVQPTPQAGAVSAEDAEAQFRVQEAFLRQEAARYRYVIDEVHIIRENAPHLPFGERPLYNLLLASFGARGIAAILSVDAGHFARHLLPTAPQEPTLPRDQRQTRQVRRGRPKPDTLHHALVSPEVAAARLSLGRTTVYALIKAGQLLSVKVGKRRLVPVHALERFAGALEQTR